MVLLLLTVQIAVARPAGPVRDSVPFARLVQSLSEPGGYFDSDNLISNESSYLHIGGVLRSRADQGEAYVGVGPDQNFSYIAAVRPSIAFIVDLRRDNLVLHLLYKSLFELARNRLEFLCLLFGRPVPADLPAWDGRSLTDLLGYLDHTVTDTARHARTQATVAEKVRGYGLGPRSVDYATLKRFHDQFMQAGLELRFTSYGRGPRSYYPTIRQLYLEKDLAGREASFLAQEDDFRYVQSLERRGRVIPLVGDFGGTRTFKGIGRYLKERGAGVSLFYTSNVEFYVFRQQVFRRYADNVRALPFSKHGLIARSYFGGVMGQPHPQARSGYASVQLLQTAESFLRQAANPDRVSYWDLVTRNPVDLLRP